MPERATAPEPAAFILPPAQEDAAKLAALKRIKFLATASLVLCVAAFAMARIFEPQFPILGFVAAFAEAAAIGGIADWYAVVALFRRPLGLPLPHSAIIPRNQDRIADNLGRFIEVNFLAPGPVREKLEEVDFAALVADWLADERQARELATFVARMVPQTVQAIEGSGLRDFVSDRMLEQMEKVEVAPLAAELLTAFTDDQRHQKLFNEIIKVVGRFLKDEEALDAMREKIREELPTLANLFRADTYLLNKIVSSTAALLDEVRATPGHPLRQEFDRFVSGFIQRLRRSPEYRRRAERLKKDLLSRPELRDMAQEMWKSLRGFLEQDAKAPDSVIRKHLANLFVDIGKQLAGQPQIRADMNRGFVVALATFVEKQKSGVSSFIAGQVKKWDLGQLTNLIEINVGRDLQFIRFNGMIIGGIAGLLLHTGELLFLSN